jgi:hypothetical protein
VFGRRAVFSCAGLLVSRPSRRTLVQDRERRRVAARRALATRRPRQASELGRAGRVSVSGFDPRFCAGGKVGAVAP